MKCRACYTTYIANTKCESGLGCIGTGSEGNCCGCRSEVGAAV